MVADEARLLHAQHGWAWGAVLTLSLPAAALALPARGCPTRPVSAVGAQSEFVLQWMACPADRHLPLLHAPGWAPAPGREETAQQISIRIPNQWELRDMLSIVS